MSKFTGKPSRHVLRFAPGRGSAVSGSVRVVSGCGEVEHFSVTGSVTLDGRPLSDAAVSFMPGDEQGVPSLGIADRRGICTLAAGGRPARYHAMVWSW
ncbi:MAG TPA: hypothetical protein VMY37_11635 [Thermoguttaceae bacterium]|nr:hypothetical protein [Thermoguttaceae bacterium]